jgi:glutathione S-transferase
VLSAAVEYVNRHYRIFEELMMPRPYVFGTQLTVLDIYVWMLSQWLDQSWFVRECPKITGLVDAVKTRPRIAPIHAANFG